MRKGLKLNKDRVFRHMAKDVGDYLILYVDSDEILKTNEFPPWFVKRSEWWRRMVGIKHKGAAEIHMRSDYDLDFMRHRFGMEARVRR